jgi:D-alanine-D-alanine ligase
VSGRPLKITVLLGGVSAEREISLITGRGVAAALREAGNEVHELDPLDPIGAVRQRELLECDVVFVALHGGWGEDGRVQALLELAGKAYVGSGPTACALAMDKILSKLVFRSMGVPTADWRALCGDESVEQLLSAREDLGGEVVLKPADEGSAIGVSLCPDEGGLRAAWEDPARRAGRWLLERYIPGRELTLPMVWGEATPVIEIVPKEGFYDYRNKYTAGCSTYHCPAEIPGETAEAVLEAGRRLWPGFGLRDMARIDFRMDPQGGVWCLELNTLPGMTELSLLPMGARELGYDFASFCDRLCRLAHERGPASSGGRP